MIEACSNNARVIVEMTKKFFNSPMGVFLYHALTGILGILVLLVFFSMMLTPSALLLFLPVIVAFNGAASGYGLADKSEIFTRQKAGLLAITTLFTLTGCSLILLFCPWEPIFDENRYFTTALVTLGTTYFGAWIARKNKALHKNS